MNQRFDLHHIQRSIILSLTIHSPLRFTELRPPRIPNNTFSYHLKKLVSHGYLESSQDGYTLTRKALKLVGMTAGQSRRISTPSLITMLYVTNDNDETLLINRNLAPFQGWYGLPSGTVHLGENIDEAARRELMEKTGIQVDRPLDLIGVLDFQYQKEATNDLFAHAVALLYAFQYHGDTEIINDKSTKFGQLSWSKFGRQHILPEAFAVREIANSGVFTKQSVSFIEPANTPVLSLPESA